MPPMNPRFTLKISPFDRPVKRLAARIARRDLIGLCVRDLRRAQPGPGPGILIQAQIRVSQLVFQQFKLTISDNGEARSAGFQKKLMFSKLFFYAPLCSDVFFIVLCSENCEI